MSYKKNEKKPSARNQVSTSKKQDIAQDNKAMADRINQNVHQFAQDVAFIEHCSLIYGEEGFRQALQAIKPYREKFSKYIDPYVNQTVFDPWDEKWFKSDEITEISAIHESKVAVQEPDSLDNSKQILKPEDSVEYQNYQFHEPVFMPPPGKKQTDFLAPFISQNLKIRKLNEDQVVVQGEKFREIVNSKILSSKKQ
ncbi:hypothetical protein SS50377_24582 [Spironucleus salmonicida]|uniref:Uncharacterized protein n=1 Tax=Spironucleus salmonicida TaxID=348837 RepID=V6LIX4_9EUKA|nr:hypothetical protein SS50377_24582 [Spironucleus salmonicida]|eukprot:EST44560.1 Hypothetical protein SS50377_15562 [Spironucleus salmonicida]